MRPGSRRRYILPLLAICALAFPAAAIAAVSLTAGTDVDTYLSIYVSPTGRDSNPGTQDAPLRHLYAAQFAVRRANRNMTGDIVVYLEDGLYRLRRPLRLTSADSGFGGNRVIWTAAPGASPIISGGRRITGWQLSDRSKNIWSAQIPAGFQSRQLYINGMRASLTSGLPPSGLIRTSFGYRASAPLSMAHWRNLSRIDFQYTGGLGLMAEPFCPIASIHGTQIAMAEPCWSNIAHRGLNWVSFGTVHLPTAMLNAFELLRRPGEFYLDPASSRLYYIPRPGENLKTADVEAPALQTLVQGTGTAAQPIHNIQFLGIQFSYATWLGPASSQGFAEVQSGFTITGANGYDTQGLCRLVSHGTCPYGDWTKEPGNVTFANDHNITFRDDKFLHLGAAGLDLGDGSQNDRVKACVFTDISGNGLEIGGVDNPQASPADRTALISVRDNHLYGLPVEYDGGVAVFVGYAAQVTIAHNQIDHTPYMGISIGWGGWLDKNGDPPMTSYTHGNVVSDNLIFDIMQVMLDGGGIYDQGPTGTSFANGEKVTGNVVYNMLQWGAALHSDNGATYITYANNVMYGNGAYDWNSVHYDYTHRFEYDPTRLQNNYWQQGWNGPRGTGLYLSGNHVIAGPGGAPASIIAAAGIQPAFASVLTWEPRDAMAPNPPERLVAWPGDHKAYISWRPSFAEGTSPVTTYTVIASSGTASGGPRVSISTARFNRLGYAVVSGLTNGRRYSFAVTASNAVGQSVASVPSRTVTPAPDTNKPGRSPGVVVHAGAGALTGWWYAPNGGDVPILGYRVSITGRHSHWVTGPSRFLMTNFRCRVIDGFAGLTPGLSYKITVQALTPNGLGPPTTSLPNQPKS